MSIADVTSFVLLSAMGVQFVVAVESLNTEPTLRMSFEPALVNRPRVVVSKFLVLSELLLGEELMLVGEDFLIPRTEIAKDLVVDALYVPV